MMSTSSQGSRIQVNYNQRFFKEAGVSVIANQEIKFVWLPCDVKTRRTAVSAAGQILLGIKYYSLAREIYITRSASIGCNNNVRPHIKNDETA